MLVCEYVARFMQGYGVGSVSAVCRKSENAVSWNIVIRKQGLKVCPGNKLVFPPPYRRDLRRVNPPRGLQLPKPVISPPYSAYYAVQNPSYGA